MRRRPRDLPNAPLRGPMRAARTPTPNPLPSSSHDPRLAQPQLRQATGRLPLSRDRAPAAGARRRAAGRENNFSRHRRHDRAHPALHRGRHAGRGRGAGHARRLLRVRGRERRREGRGRGADARSRARPDASFPVCSYGAEQGRPELRQAVVDRFYAHAGRAAGEVFISDGSKCDIGEKLGFRGLGLGFKFSGLQTPTPPLFLPGRLQMMFGAATTAALQDPACVGRGVGRPRARTPPGAPPLNPHRSSPFSATRSTSIPPSSWA